MFYCMLMHGQVLRFFLFDRKPKIAHSTRSQQNLKYDASIYIYISFSVHSLSIEKLSVLFKT